ncbi:MAG: hypothetical protein IJS58_04510 [Bacilli bacterium]|nr:hypothetical protein [Bacilli bacterium]
MNDHLIAKYRNIGMDIAEGIGILLMILGHVHISELVINHLIYAFHMPLFFIISGFFIKLRILELLL